MEFQLFMGLFSKMSETTQGESNKKLNMPLLQNTHEMKATLIGNIDKYRATRQTRELTTFKLPYQDIAGHLLSLQ